MDVRRLDECPCEATVSVFYYPKSKYEMKSMSQQKEEKEEEGSDEGMTGDMVQLPVPPPSPLPPPPGLTLQQKIIFGNRWSGFGKGHLQLCAFLLRVPFYSADDDEKVEAVVAEENKNEEISNGMDTEMERSKEEQAVVVVGKEAAAPVVGAGVRYPSEMSSFPSGGREEEDSKEKEEEEKEERNTTSTTATTTTSSSSLPSPTQPCRLHHSPLPLPTLLLPSGTTSAIIPTRNYTNPVCFTLPLWSDTTLWEISYCTLQRIRHTLDMAFHQARWEARQGEQEKDQWKNKNIPTLVGKRGETYIIDSRKRIRREDEEKEGTNKGEVAVMGARGYHHNDHSAVKNLELEQKKKGQKDERGEDNTHSQSSCENSRITPLIPVPLPHRIPQESPHEGVAECTPICPSPIRVNMDRPLLTTTIANSGSRTRKNTSTEGGADVSPAPLSTEEEVSSSSPSTISPSLPAGREHHSTHVNVPNIEDDLSNNPTTREEEETLCAGSHQSEEEEQKKEEGEKKEVSQEEEETEKEREMYERTHLARYQLHWWAGALCSITSRPRFHFLGTVVCEKVSPDHSLLIPLRSKAHRHFRGRGGGRRGGGGWRGRGGGRREGEEENRNTQEAMGMSVNTLDTEIINIPAYPGYGSPLFVYPERVQ